MRVPSGIHEVRGQDDPLAFMVFGASDQADLDLDLFAPLRAKHSLADDLTLLSGSDEVSQMQSQALAAGAHAEQVELCVGVKKQKTSDRLQTLGPR